MGGCRGELEGPELTPPRCEREQHRGEEARSRSETARRLAEAREVRADLSPRCARLGSALRHVLGLDVPGGVYAECDQQDYHDEQNLRRYFPPLELRRKLKHDDAEHQQHHEAD